MARRNRVDPWGDLHATAERGLFTGNRGCLVDTAGDLVRHHNGNLWITCVTRYRGWRHPLDAPGTWTPLFFLDDAVALAAGHRPCGLCRRDEYLSYRAAVERTAAADAPILATDLNRRLAKERHRRGRGLVRMGDRILHEADVDGLPVGAVVLDRESGTPHLVMERHLQPFGFAGWGQPAARPSGLRVEVLTPATSVGALANGFVPRLHSSADAS